MSEVLKLVGLVAAVVSLGAGLLLLSLRTLNSLQAQKPLPGALGWMVWVVGVAGLCVFLVGHALAEDGGRAGERGVVPDFRVELACGVSPPGDGSELARLFEYAEDNRGAAVQVRLDFDVARCACSSHQQGPLVLLERVCQHNPEWHLAERMKQYVCVQAVGLAGFNAGVGSLCFPSPELIAAERGYTAEQTSGHLRITGDFLVGWEWSLGAPHVQLLLPE